MAIWNFKKKRRKRTRRTKLISSLQDGLCGAKQGLEDHVVLGKKKYSMYLVLSGKCECLVPMKTVSNPPVSSHKSVRPDLLATFLIHSCIIHPSTMGLGAIIGWVEISHMSTNWCLLLFSFRSFSKASALDHVWGCAVSTLYLNGLKFWPAGRGTTVWPKLSNAMKY